MRLDKFIAQQLGVSRAIAGREIRGSRVTVDGDIVKDASFKLQPEHEVEYDGNTLTQQNGPRNEVDTRKRHNNNGGGGGGKKRKRNRNKGRY